MKRAKRDKLPREVILEGAGLSNAEARFLVSNYYAAQDMRKRLDMQIRHLPEGDPIIKTPDDPNSKVDARGMLLASASERFVSIEDDMKRALQQYAEAHPVGRWCMSLVGVGPITAAGVLAHIDITKAPAAGNIWTFAGLNPEAKWEKGQKRPFNRELRQIMWHFGQNAKRFSNNPDSVYGQLYRTRKELVVERNNVGFNAERAKTFFTKSNDVKKVLKMGMLPAGNLDSQACNYAAKIFLSHLHAVLYWNHYGKAPAKPFSIAIQGHAHEIRIPEIEQFPGLERAYYGVTELAGEF